MEDLLPTHSSLESRSLDSFVILELMHLEYFCEPTTP
jgi:hypothetical protein